MEEDKLFNPLIGFDYSILNEKTFGEDAVREEIITPILKALGYSAFGSNKIIRSPRLQHPYVSIGSARKQVSLIPDYLMQVDEKNAWILEAKAPTESIVKSAHVEQAYGYAVHSEVLVKHFVLCNGKEFAIYSVGESELLQLHFSIYELPIYWNDLEKILAPKNIFTYTKKLNKDLGLHLKWLGLAHFDSIIFKKVLVPHIAQINRDLFTFASTAIIGETQNYCASFDFDLAVAQQLEGKIPYKGFDILMKPYEQGIIKKIVFGDQKIFLNVETILSDNLEQNDNEIFQPLIVKRFLL